MRNTLKVISLPVGTILFVFAVHFMVFESFNAPWLFATSVLVLVTVLTSIFMLTAHFYTDGRPHFPTVLATAAGCMAAYYALLCHWGGIPACTTLGTASIILLSLSLLSLAYYRLATQKPR